jgi:FAD synthetase
MRIDTKSYSILLLLMLHKTVFMLTPYHGMNKTMTSTELLNFEYYDQNSSIALPEDKKIVLVGGCFDILHFGHMHFLQKAKEAGDYLVVALEPDERISQSKFRSPSHTQEERAYNLLALRFVDKVILLPMLNGFDDYKKLVQSIKPNIIAVTADDPHVKNKEKQAECVNATCLIVTERIGTFSSSAIYEQKTNENKKTT